MTQKNFLKKKFLQGNTIPPYIRLILMHCFVLKTKIYGIASAYLKCLRYYQEGILYFVDNFIDILSAYFYHKIYLHVDIFTLQVIQFYNFKILALLKQ